MARGRMISKSLSTSEKFASLVTAAGERAEFCQALYPLIVAHSDDFGRLQGDAFTVKHMCFPASPRSLDEFSTALRLLDGVGLTVWYGVAGKRYLQIVEFERHQQGLHRRTRSQFPRVPGTSGKDEELPSEEKGTELKRTQGKRREQNPPNPPDGGRVTTKELRAAKEVLRLRLGACRHDPPCGGREACLLAIVEELRLKVGAA